MGLHLVTCCQSFHIIVEKHKRSYTLRGNPSHIRLRQPSRDFVTLLHLDRNLDTFLDAFAYVCPRMPCLCVCYMRKLSYVWDTFGSVPTHKLFVLLFHSYVLCTFCRDMRIRFYSTSRRGVRDTPIYIQILLCCPPI